MYRGNSCRWAFPSLSIYLFSRSRRAVWFGASAPSMQLPLRSSGLLYRSNWSSLARGQAYCGGIDCRWVFPTSSIKLVPQSNLARCNRSVGAAAVSGPFRAYSSTGFTDSTVLSDPGQMYAAWSCSRKWAFPTSSLHLLYRFCRAMGPGTRVVWEL